QVSTLASDLQGYINSDAPRLGQKIHSRIIKSGFRSNLNISIKLLILHLKSSCLSYARQVFDELPARTLSAYNYMISGCLKNGEIMKSLDLAREMTISGEKPDNYTYSMILKASTSSGLSSLHIGREVHGQILKHGIENDDVLYTALVDAYVKHGNLNCARRVFDLMLPQNVISSTSMIAGYMNQGCINEAEDVFAMTPDKDVVVYNAMIEGYSRSVETAEMAVEVCIDMQRRGYRPTLSTYASVTGACSLLSSFDIGRQLQGQLMKTGFFGDVKMGSALIDMYSKCGRTDDARRIFDGMPCRNVFSWTSLIDGYGKNGIPEESLRLFETMLKESDTAPNDVTFLGAISACAHAGLVSRGQEIFDSMERDHGVKPKMEHYACMIDLFGRAGCLERALEFVANMPEVPNADVWSALLGSCKLHGDFELARVAAEELLMRGGEKRSGPYVTMSNAFAEVGRWDCVSELREVMKARGVARGG
ncbi:hypothetical protein M569_13038, partial [Genlisea aurea]